MKKCPTCEKTFEDNMRFCQADGTPLVDASEPVDPYKTTVAKHEEIAAAIPPLGESQPKEEGEVLHIPEPDPLKTMYASEDEIRREMGASDEPVMEIPPLPTEPPKFSAPDLSAPDFGAMSPPPSPFSSSESDKPFAAPSEPIPSPFGEPKPPTYEPPVFKEPEPPVFEQASANPFSYQPMQEFTPQTPPEPAWQNPMGQSGPMQPPPASAGQNKTLAIVSLVLSLLSIPCCGFIIFGIAGAIVGFIAKGKADSNPSEYGGRGIALAAVIIGIITTLIGIIGNALALIGVIPIPNF